MAAVDDRVSVLECKLKVANHSVQHLTSAIRQAIRVLSAYERMAGDEAHLAPSNVRKHLTNVVGDPDAE